MDIQVCIWHRTSDSIVEATVCFPGMQNLKADVIRDGRHQ